MTTDLRDHVLGLLLRKMAALVMAPSGPLPPHGPLLRGVVGYGDDSARVAFSPNPHMDTGVGFEFLLVDGDRQLNVDAAIDWLRTTATQTDPSGLAPRLPKRYDSHTNLLIDARDAGFVDNARDAQWHDHNLFSLLSILIHGGGYPWFEDVYTCVGFMIPTAGVCRLYIRPTSTGTVYGLQVPLKSADGSFPPGMAGTFPQELASVVRVGDLPIQKTLDVHDDYCEQVFDMTSWVGPDAPQIA